MAKDLDLRLITSILHQLETELHRFEKAHPDQPVRALELWVTGDGRASIQVESPQGRMVAYLKAERDGDTMDPLDGEWKFDRKV